ncbi:MAG: hypothetical protein U9P70_04620, partial [Patescibacteria group bacterium]|nr:hypothetical protein [Patescibacteria group bacterium]
INTCCCSSHLGSTALSGLWSQQSLFYCVSSIVALALWSLFAIVLHSGAPQPYQDYGANKCNAQKLALRYVPSIIRKSAIIYPFKTLTITSIKTI